MWHWGMTLGKSVGVALGNVMGEECSCGTGESLWGRVVYARFTEKLIAHFCVECSRLVRKQDLVLLAPCEKYLTAT